MEKESFYDLINLTKVLSPLFIVNNREEFLQITASAVTEAIEDLSCGVDAGDYDYDISVAVEAAKEEYRYYQEIDVYDIQGYIEADIEATVISDIQNGIDSLPEDVQNRIILDEHISITVNGAWEMAKSYLADDGYDYEYEAPGDQWDEIDSIFQRT